MLSHSQRDTGAVFGSVQSSRCRACMCGGDWQMLAMAEARQQWSRERTLMWTSRLGDLL
jgi:hypothetical protein